jgi:hypothetical protein
MKFNNAINEIYTRDKYKNYRGGIYYPDGIDLHVEDKETDYQIGFNLTDKGLIVHIAAAGTQRIPKGFDTTKEDIPYEIKPFELMDKEFTVREFYNFCSSKVNRQFMEYVTIEAGKKGCKFDEYSNTLEKLTRSIYFLTKNKMNRFEFKVLEDEVNGIKIQVKKSDEYFEIYNSHREDNPETIGARQEQSKKRKIHALSNLGYRVQPTG